MILSTKMLASPDNESRGGGFGSKSPKVDEKSGYSGPKQLKILIVDDESMMRRVCARVLKPLGCSFLDAENGKDALDIFRNGDVDLIISDFQMPGMTGLELLIEAKRIDPCVKFICMSGDHNEKRLAVLIEAGAMGTVDKPIDIDILKGMVKSALDMDILREGKTASAAGGGPEGILKEATPAEGASKQGMARTKATILVVDDEADTRSGMERLIEIPRLFL